MSRDAGGVKAIEPAAAVAWSQVGEKRRAHIARVTALLDRWAPPKMSIAPAQKLGRIAGMTLAAGMTRCAMRRKVSSAISCGGTSSAPDSLRRRAARPRSRRTPRTRGRGHGRRFCSQSAGTRLEMPRGITPVVRCSWRIFLNRGVRLPREDRAFLASLLLRAISTAYSGRWCGCASSGRCGKVPLFPESIVLWDSVSGRLRHGHQGPQETRCRWILIIGILLIGLGALARYCSRSGPRMRASSGPVEPMWCRRARTSKSRFSMRPKTKALARRAMLAMRRRGFDVVFFGNSTERADTTRVIDRSGHADWALLAARCAGRVHVEEVPDSSRFLDLTILVGRQLDAAAPARSTGRSWPCGHAAAISTPRLFRIATSTPCTRSFAARMRLLPLSGIRRDKSHRTAGMQRNEIHERLAASCEHCEFVRDSRRVVHPAEHDVFECHAAIKRRGGVDHGGEREFRVDRHERCAQRVRRCVHRDREAELLLSRGQRLDPRQPADSRHRDVPGRADLEALGIIENRLSVLSTDSQFMSGSPIPMNTMFVANSGGFSIASSRT